jgi:gliding motility-associated-like protein
MVRKILLTIVLSLSLANLFAQSNLGCPWNTIMNNMLCGNQTIVGDDQNFCNDGVKLWLQYNNNTGVAYNDSMVRIAFGSTDSYAVASMNYNWEALAPANQIPSGVNIDDTYSDAIPLPFEFCFYGNKYDSIVIGSNGNATFNTDLALGYDSYFVSNFGPLPFNYTSYNNSIFCPFHDLNTFLGGNIYYGVVGTAPCRKFIITWDNVPYFDCPNFTSMQQIVLHERSFRIDINIEKKDVCSQWEDGLAYMGIQNNDFNKFATWAPYNQATPWLADTVSFQFNPIGTQNTSTNGNPLSYGIYWIDSATNTVLGVGDTFNWYPPQDTTIYVFIGDTSLLNNPNYINNNDSLQACGKGLCCTNFTQYKRLTVDGPVANFTYTETQDCNGPVVSFTNLSSGAIAYDWFFGDGSGSPLPNPIHNYIGNGPFVVSLVAYGTNCSDTFTQVLPLNYIPVQALFTLNNNNICSTTPLLSTNTSTGISNTYQWQMGDGSTYTTNTINHLYSNGGTYTITLTATDNFGCTSVYTLNVVVEKKENFTINANPNPACVGQAVNFTGSNFASLLGTNWNMGDGGTTTNSTNFSYGYGTAGTYTVTCVTDFNVCPNQTVSLIIDVDPYPTVDLGKPENICSGKESLVIIDNNNPGAQYTWSTGAVGTNSITVTGAGIYTVEVSYGNCKSTGRKEVGIDLECIPIMNAFSPNDDDVNDYFLPLWTSTDDIQEYSVRIFNRFGNEVYASTNKTERGWNGRFNGEKCDVGVYVYTITMKDKVGNVRNVTGDVTLIR